MQDTLMTAEEAATRLHVSRLRVYELVSLGHLPCVRLGRSIRLDPVEINNFIARGGTTAPHQEDEVE